MLKFTQKSLQSILLNKPLMFRFGAGGHQINRDKMVLSDPKSGYFLDPNDVARRVMRVIAQHDKVQNPESMTLNTQWWELGINELDYVEIMLGVEGDFGIQISDENLEKFKDINDAVEYVARSFFSV